MTESVFVYNGQRCVWRSMQVWLSVSRDCRGVFLEDTVLLQYDACLYVVVNKFLAECAVSAPVLSQQFELCH